MIGWLREALVDGCVLVREEEGGSVLEEEGPLGRADVEPLRRSR